MKLQKDHLQRGGREKTSPVNHRGSVIAVRVEVRALTASHLTGTGKGKGKMMGTGIERNTAIEKESMIQKEEGTGRRAEAGRGMMIGTKAERGTGTGEEG